MRLALAFVVPVLVLVVSSCGAPPAGNANCTQGVAGPWTASGAAFAMVMHTTTTFSDCKATFANWDQAMSKPDGATLSGKNVTFTGTGWTDCTGTITDDGMTITGACADGSALSMAMQQ